MSFLSSGIEPSLIHAVEVMIKRIDHSTTAYDDDFREPVNSEPEYKDPQEVLCQVHYEKFDRMNMKSGGDDPMSKNEEYDGWLTFRTSDFEDIEGGIFKKGDRIIMVDEEEVDFAIEHIDRKGHYRTAKLIKLFFKKREEG